MTDKSKKIDRRYVLSDSSVNVYGFRLLTEGCVLDEFRKNPIGYYMHRREDGIAVKWEGLAVEDDKITGTPVINLCNPRGEQTYDEAENGFLNAASVGHIVVLEYSTEPEMMLPGQTGATITKWYHKECSLVDIPGNCNALTTLYDANENELNLAALSAPLALPVSLQQDIRKELNILLQLNADSGDAGLLGAVQGLSADAATLLHENTTLRNDRQALQQQIDEMNAAGNRATVTALLDRALEDRKITVALRDKLAADYAANAEGLKSLLAAMPAYRTIAKHLSSRKPQESETQWEWDDYEKQDATGTKLKELRANDPGRYKELFERKFAA